MLPSSRNGKAPLSRAQRRTTGQFEAPLQKPVQPGPQIPFDQCSSVFAVDVSGSTSGVVLEQEIDAIKSISENLPSTTKQLCSIIPWDDEIYQPLHLDQVDVLEAIGLTRPDKLLSDNQSRELLQKSHLWFLLTDGEIPHIGVQAFAKAMNTHKLHGKACVLIIFGYRSPTPTDCNISVGISAFSVVPDCVFLFHDVESHDLFVLQTKGCFDRMNSMKNKNIILDEHTVWEDLPLTSYDSLFTIQVPQPLDLKGSEIILQNRQQIDLDKLCRDEIGCEDNDAILNNDENLKAVLLTLSTRGRTTEAKDWLTRQKANANDISQLPRVDVSNNAMQAVKELVSVMTNQALPRDEGRVRDSGGFTAKLTIQARIGRLQSKLRLAHESNWEELSCSVQARKEKTIGRNMMLNDGLARLSMVEEKGLHSPRIMTPINSDGEISSRLSAPFRSTPTYDYNLSSPEIDIKGCNLPNRITYIPGYYLEESRTSATPRLCPLCNGTAVSYAVLLKAYPSGPPTPGFPSRGSRSGILFPLAVSGFRETDVMSQFVCCDACAVHLITYGLSPFNENLKTFLPVLPPLDSRKNKETWLNAVDGFFEKRFEQRNLMSIMLAIFSNAYDTFKADAETDNMLLCAVLQIACTQLSADCRISYGPGRFGSMTEAMIFYFQERTVDVRNELLQHPVESFTLLLRYTPGVQYIDLRLRTRALFLRLVLHILEHLVESRGTAQGRIASDYLNQLKEWESARKGKDYCPPDLTADPKQRSRKDAVVIHTLKAHNLVDVAVLDCFGSLGELWQALQDTCLVALHMCLCALADKPLTDKVALKVLEHWNDQKDLHTILMTPEMVNEDF